MKAKTSESADGVVINSRGEILVVSQRGTSWSLPKGHIDSGEKALETAKREIYEESGINQLDYIKDLGSYKRYKISDDGKSEDKSEIKKIHLFLFKTKETQLKPMDPHNPEAKWVNREMVAELLTHPKDKEFFLKVKKEIGRIV